MKNSHTIKQRLISLQGKKTSVDYFLFHAYEEEKNKNSHRAFYRENSYPELESFLISDEPFATVVKSLISWHTEKTPLLSETETFDYLAINQIIPSFIALKLDLDKVIVEYPLIPKPSLQKLEEPTNESPSTDEQSKEISEENKLVEESESESKNEEGKIDSALKGFDWKSLEETLEENFPQLAVYMLAYLKWSYTEHKKTQIDFDSIPPCGRYLYHIKKEFPYSDIIYKPKNDKFTSVDNVSRVPKTIDPQKLALDDVFYAINKLKKDSTLKSIKLKPQNSFLRRIQHKKVYMTKGFSSKSTGEKNNRALEIFRD